MSKIPTYLYRKTEQAKAHAIGLFEDVYLIKLIPNTQYRQKNAAGDVIFEITSEPTQTSVCAFNTQDNMALNLDWFDAKHKVWYPFKSDDWLFDMSVAAIEKLAKNGFRIDHNCSHVLYLYDIAAMLVNRFGGTWQVFNDHVLQDGLLKIRHDLRVENGFFEGTSDWAMSGKISEFANDVAEKLERFKTNNLPKIYTDIKDGAMSLDQFIAKFGR